MKTIKQAPQLLGEAALKRIAGGASQTVPYGIDLVRAPAPTTCTDWGYKP